LHPFVGEFLEELIGSDVAVAPFAFGGVTYTAAYYKRDRKIAGQSLTLDVSYRSHPLVVPQHFLNEARLSALALAIYLAAGWLVRQQRRQMHSSCWFSMTF